MELRKLLEIIGALYELCVAYLEAAIYWLLNTILGAYNSRER